MKIRSSVFEISHPLVPSAALRFMKGYLGGYDYVDVKKDRNDMFDTQTEPESSGIHKNGKF